VVSGTGTIVGLGPISAVGEITYDGQGNSIATYTASVNGTIHKGVTGSHSESDGSHYDFVVTPDGNTAKWIETDTGTVVTGTEVRLKRLHTNLPPLSSLSPSTIAAPCAGRAVPGVVAIWADPRGKEPRREGSRQFQRSFEFAACTLPALALPPSRPPPRRAGTGWERGTGWPYPSCLPFGNGCNFGSLYLPSRHGEGG